MEDLLIVSIYISITVLCLKAFCPEFVLTFFFAPAKVTDEKKVHFLKKNDRWKKKNECGSAAALVTVDCRLQTHFKF